MTENMKKFLELVSKNEELTAKLGALTKDELIAMAKELGVDLTEADFAQNNEVSEDELEAVAGGGICACPVGGGGTADNGSGQIPCACVLGGGGQYKDYYGKKHMRCTCFGGGAGEDIG